MIHTLFQAQLNRILNLNPHYLTYLQEVAEHSVAVRFTDLPFAFALKFHHSYIEVSDDLENVDLVLSGGVTAFIRFAAQKDNRQALLQRGEVEFEGELMTLQKVEAFLSHFNFRFLSFIPIAKIKQFLSNQIEYWQEEKQILASPILFDHIHDELLSLEERADRLQALVQQFESDELPKQ